MGVSIPFARTHHRVIILAVLSVGGWVCFTPSALMAADGLKVGAAAVNLQCDETMVISGSIEPRYVKDQEGELRSVAIVLSVPGQAPIGIVACDVLCIPKSIIDPALAEVEARTGIKPENVLVNATHTHHAPSAAPIHGSGASAEFCEILKQAITQSLIAAHQNLSQEECEFYFHLGEETTVGGNSRLKLPDGKITWINPLKEAGENIEPTGPFDPELPVLDFRSAAGESVALIYNHSTHTIGTRNGNVRSPSFYGLAAQELETERGGIVAFLEGASGSTHNITQVPVAEAIERMKQAVTSAREQAKPRSVTRLASLKRPFKFNVRTFNEGEEDVKVASYTKTYVPSHSDYIREVFSTMRKTLNDQQGEERETWIQAMVIGDVALVGVPAEYFTSLGVDIKKRSPYQQTYVAELANDYVGYLPDLKGHQLGGYQTWMGLHSYAEPGTGERMADAVVEMLEELANDEANVSATDVKKK